MTAHQYAREPLAVDMIASLATFIVSAAVASFVMSGALPLTAYLFAHLGCAAAAILIALISGNPPRRQAVLHALMATFLGPAGSAGVFLCTVFELCFRPFATPFTEWFESIFPEQDNDEQGAFVELLHASEDPIQTSLRISSFRDTMAVGTIEQKQALLALIARRFTPAFAPALRQALQDSVPAVRVQAAAATASIENRYAEKTMALEQKAKQRSATIADHRRLAEHLMEFADSGIAEQQRCDEARKRALEQFDAILISHPSDFDALTASARLLLHAGRFGDAHQRIQKASSTGRMDTSLASLQLEALVAMGRFSDIKTAAASWKRVATGSERDAHRLKSALQLWSGDVAHVS